MKPYPHIDTIWKRDERTHRIIEDDWTCPEFEYLRDNIWHFTEKVDGTNIRVMYDGQQVTFGGRSDNAQIPVPLTTMLWRTLHDTAKWREVWLEDSIAVCLYGEGYGEGIQKSGSFYKHDGVDFAVFDVWISGWWLERHNVEDVASKLGLQVVPIIGQGTLLDAAKMARAGFQSRWGNFAAEGIVARPQVDLFNRKGERIIAKIKRRDFAK